MALHKNDWKDRQRIREETFFYPGVVANEVLFGPEGLKRRVTPVLLSFWTQEYLDTFLIPATEADLEVLKKVHGVDQNGSGCQDVQTDLNYILNKISLTYEEEGTGDEVPQGSWRERYFVDTYDGEENPLPPITLPTGTLLIITGYIP